MNNKYTKAFYANLAMPSTAMGFALCVQISALSWILNTEYGLNEADVGLIWASGPMAGIIGQVLVGIISDNVWFMGGRRRPFIIIGGAIAAAMILALPNMDVIQETMGLGSLVGVAITVALTLDLAINVSYNPARSIIADVTPEGEERTNGFTWMQTISGFFGVLAYLIGAFFGNMTLIWVGAIFVLVAAVFPVLFIKEPRVLEAKKEEEVTNANTNETDIPEFLKICGAHAFTWIGVQTMFVYIFFYIKEVILAYEAGSELPAGVGDEIGFNIGIAFAILNTVGFLLPAFVLQPIANKIGRVKTHTISIAVMAVGYALLAFFGNTTMSLFILMAVVGIGWAAVVSLPFAIMSEVVNQKRMGLFMGLFNLSVVIPQLISSGLGGFIESQGDKSMIFWISAVCLGISALLWLLVKEQKEE
jgi:maltose/moltooligosaccharide transporter